MEPQSLIGRTVSHYRILHGLGRDDEAWRAVKSGLDMYPNDYYIMRILIYCANTLERAGEAIDEARKIAMSTKSAAIGRGILAFAYAKAGDRKQAAEIVRELEQAPVHALGLGYYIGMTCTILGENEKGMEWLEKAEQAKLGLLMIVATEPTFSALRPFPRFQALLGRLGLANS